MRRSRLDSVLVFGVLSLVLLFAVPAAVWFGKLANTGEITGPALGVALRATVESLPPGDFVPLAWCALTGAAGGFVVSVWLIREETRKRARLRFQELSALLGRTASVESDDLVPLARRILAAGGGSADRFFEAGGAVHEQFRKLKAELSVEHLPTLRWRDGEIFDDGGEERLQRLKPLLEEMRSQWPPHLGQLNDSLNRVIRSDARAK